VFAYRGTRDLSVRDNRLARSGYRETRNLIVRDNCVTRNLNVFADRGAGEGEGRARVCHRGTHPTGAFLFRWHI